MTYQGSKFNNRSETQERKTERPELPSLMDFTNTLHDHIWSFDLENFRDFINARKKENDLFHVAMRGGPNYMREYVFAERRAMYARTEKAVGKIKKQLSEHYGELIATGDEEFDRFRQTVNNLDWYADFSDDPNVWRNAEARQKEVKAYAEEKGGLYLTYLKTVSARIANHISSGKTYDNS